MRKVIIYSIVLCFCSLSTYAQTVSNDMIYFVINQYVGENFDTTIAQNIYININTGEKNYNYTMGNTKIILFDSTQERRFYRKLIRLDGKFLSLNIRSANSDTIDFVFSKCQITKENRYYHIELECGGDLGGMPFARFIYAKDRKEWDYVSHETMMSGR